MTRRDYRLMPSLKIQTQDIFCLILAYVIRLFYCILYPIQPKDAYIYIKYIIQWEEQGKPIPIIEDIYYPLSLWLLKAPHHFFGMEIVKGGIILNLLLGILIVALLMTIARLFFKEDKIILFVGLIAATHPMLVHFSCVFLRENTYLFFSLLTFYCLAKYCMRFDLIDLVGTGLFGSLASLCRIEGLEFIIVISLVLFLFVYVKKKQVYKAIRHFIVFVLAFGGTHIVIMHFLGEEFNVLHLIKDNLNIHEFQF